MAVKKKAKKKVVPYNPYKPYGDHSLTWYQQQANARAATDTNAQVAALPRSQFYTDSAAQLAKALQGIQGNQAGIASAGGDLYSQAFQQASQPASKAAMVAGGQPVAGPANTSLVGALGATMAQAFAGGQDAAVARGRNDVLARAGQETAIRAKQPTAAAAYLKEMTDAALQARVAQFNEQLAGQQFGLDASNTAFDNNLAAASLEASTSSKADSAAAKKSAAQQKLVDKKLSAVEKRLVSWMKPVRKQTGNLYTFQPPGLPAFEISAKDGPSALQLAMQKLANQGIKGLTGTQVGSYLKSTKPVTTDVPQKSKRDAYRIALRQLSGPGGVMTKKEATRWLRDYFGVSQTGPLKL